MEALRGKKDAKSVHSHCETCYKRFCDDNLSCKIINCEIGCGARFHHCKGADHKAWCPLEKAPCINRENGCPAFITRWKLGIHLETCPASVIRCTSEWNRWPLHSHDMKAKAAIPLSNPHIRCAQLDVALAMRDQRMLIQSLKAPLKTRRVLRNALTKRFPAVPFDFRSSSVESDLANSADTSCTVSDDDSDAPWESSTCPPGLQRSVCSQLYRASQQTTECLSEALNVVTNHMNGHVAGTGDKKEISPDSSQISDSQSVPTINQNVSVTANIKSPGINQSKSMTDKLSASFEQREFGSVGCSKKRSVSNLCASPDGHQIVDYSTEIENEAKRLLSLKAPLKLNEVLGVDINIESITRYQAKPPSMYTFLCAQEFRRDEYPWHFKNVHNDIHCLLNGWLEQRCPLAYCGCEFSFRRFFPTENGSEIIHSMTLESFGVRPPFEKSWACYKKDASTDMSAPSNMETDCNNSNIVTGKEREATPEISTSYKYDSNIHIQPFYSKGFIACAEKGGKDAQDLLAILPYELLHKIAICLDGFSLCNLSLTCKYLRELCCYMLEERGVVVQVWEKRKLGHRNSWQVAYKRWFFSSSFSPVERWIFQGYNPLADHLKVCPFNQIQHYTETRVKLPILYTGSPIKAEPLW